MIVKFNSFIVEKVMPFDIIEVIFDEDLESFKKILNDKKILKYVTEDGDSILHLAVDTGNLEMVKMVISKGVNVNIFNDFLETPLHQAAYDDELEIFKYLVSVGADLNAEDKRYETPIDNAMKRDNIDIVEYIISLNKPINNIENIFKSKQPNIKRLFNSYQFQDWFISHYPDKTSFILDIARDDIKKKHPAIFTGHELNLLD